MMFWPNDGRAIFCEFTEEKTVRDGHPVVSIFFLLLFPLTRPCRCRSGQSQICETRRTLCFQKPFFGSCKSGDEAKKRLLLLQCRLLACLV